MFNLFTFFRPPTISHTRNQVTARTWANTLHNAQARNKHFHLLFSSINNNK